MSAPEPGVVVVGASLAGLRTTERLRSAGYGGPITVFGDEPHMPYNRPPLSKAALKGGAAIEDLAFPIRQNCADVVWRLARRVAGSDLAAHQIVLDDGDVVRYDSLVIATGLRPRRLNVPGPVAGRFVIRTRDDVLAVRDRLDSDASVVVIGASFIGCEVAATARQTGARVRIVAPESAPMERVLGKRLGAELRRRHEAHGVGYHLERSVESFVGEHAATAVALTDGAMLDADVIIEAVGSVPNNEWLQGNGLDLSAGVVCDSAMRVVGASDVVAVGDVAAFPQPFGGTPQRVEHWSVAGDTARLAADTLLGSAASASSILPSFWSDQFDIRLNSYGYPHAADEARLLEGDWDSSAVIGYFKEHQLCGVVSLGRPRALIPYRKALLESLAGEPERPGDLAATSAT